MIRILIVLCMLCGTHLSLAAELSAQVNRTNINAHDILDLTITVKDATAKHEPDFSSLEAYFSIYTRSSFSNISFINGKKTVASGWKMELVPIVLGKVMIPEFQIATEVGILKSQPIAITIIQDDIAKQQADSKDNLILLEASVSKDSAYLHQAFVYTVKLITQLALYNLQTPELQIADAIVEKMGENKMYTDLYNGNQVSVFEMNYLVTPLQSGTLLLPAVQLKGDVKVDRIKNYDPFFDNFFSGTLFGQNNLKPFVVTSADLKIIIQPPVSQQKEWLPLESLVIDDLSKVAETNTVGEPITRCLKLSAVGGTAKSLPSLEAFNMAGKIKVYPKQPVLNTTLANNGSNKISSSREETYTIIPEQAGDIVLPEISIAWWDVTTNELKHAILPAKVMRVVAAATKIEVDSSNPDKSNMVVSTNESLDGLTTVDYIIICLVIFILILLAIIGYLVFIKNSTKHNKVRYNIPSNKLVSKINKIESLPEIYKFLQEFATDTWGMPKNMALKNIVVFLQQHHYSGNLKAVEELFMQINAAVYQQTPLDLYVVKNMLQIELPKIKKISATEKAIFAKLNPT